jgi:tetratricopeptide (TPR) repeat protein/predicted Ser/Thr protein kinase
VRDPKEKTAEESTIDESTRPLERKTEASEDERSEHGPLALGSEALGQSFAQAETLLESEEELRESGGALLESGDSLGRLEVGEILGQGAFGVVVAAYDPDLKRKLAIKLLKPEVFESKSGRDAHKRLLREARAMAKISHANVVTVHDIGTVDEQVYIAMEFVEGGNLRSWLSESERDWKEILKVFVQAGRGLAAAHREGLVHRDFKPDNVLVNNRGEVRVADFGLVSISEKRGEALASGAEESSRSNTSGDMDITRAGSLMGTALYMSPEQHLGEEVTPASDQFSFCVALYSAFYGREPFACQNYKELRKAVIAGEVLPVPASTEVPKWIQAVVRRGLSTEAEDRYPSMPALLEALFDDPLVRRRRRRKLAGAGFVGCALVGALFWSQSGERRVCQNAGANARQVWNEPARASITAAFTAGERGEEVLRFERAVDGYTRDWASARTRVCEATRILGSQSDTLLDQRMGCLDQRLNYLSQLLAQLTVGANAQTLDKAVKAVHSMPSLSSCTQQVLASQPLPEDPEERARVIQARDQVDEAWAHFELGSQARSVEILEAMLEEPVSYAPVLAKATRILGSSKSILGDLDGAEESFLQSIDHATRAGDDHMVASSWLGLMQLDGIEREDYTRGHGHGNLARLAMVRGKAGALQMAELDRSRAALMIFEGKHADALALLNKAAPIVEEQGSDGEIATFRTSQGDAEGGNGNYKAALGHYRLALAHIESALGKNHPENIYVLNNMAVALKNHGDVPGARQALERSLAITERSYGPSHRSVVVVLTNLGNIYRREGELSLAKETFARAIRVGVETMEEGHPQVTKAMMNLAIVHAADKDYARATEAFREVLIRADARFPEDHPDRAMALNNLGESLFLEEKYAESLTYAQLALEMKVRIYGEAHPKIASTVASLGAIYEAMGKKSDAERSYQEALGLFHGAAGEEHPRTIAMLSALGRFYESTGAARKARSFLERAIAARGLEAAGLEHVEDRFALIRVQARSQSRAAALTAAQALQEELGDDRSKAALAKELQSWIDGH